MSELKSALCSFCEAKNNGKWKDKTITIHEPTCIAVGDQLRKDGLHFREGSGSPNFKNLREARQ
jgi:hypothetical protein